MGFAETPWDEMFRTETEHMQFRMRDDIGRHSVSMLYRSGNPDVPYAIDRPFVPDVICRNLHRPNLQHHPAAYGLYNQPSYFKAPVTAEPVQTPWESGAYVVTTDPGSRDQLMNEFHEQ